MSYLSAAQGALVTALESTLSIDNATRRTAEARLQQMGAAPGFGLALLKLALDTGRHLLPGVRQLAAVYMKQFVRECWSPEVGGSRFTDQEKNEARQLMLRGLFDPSRLMRTAFGMCVAVVARIDFPEEWPDLLQHLTAMLSSSKPQAVFGAARCISLFSDFLDDQSVSKFGPSLFPTLASVLKNDVVYGPETRRSICYVVKTCASLLAALRDSPEHSAFAVLMTGIQTLLHPLVQSVSLDSWKRQRSWAAKAASQQGSGTDEVEDHNLGNGFGVQIEALQTMNVVVNELYKLCDQQLTAIFSQIWKFYEDIEPLYAQNIVDRKGGAGVDVGLEATAFDSEGNDVGLQVVIVQIFEFLNCAAVSPSSTIRNLMSMGLSKLCRASLLALQMTSDQVETWHRDPNEFVLHMEDEENSLHARSVAACLLYELIDSHGETALIAASQVFEWGLHCADDARKRGVNSWWKLLEASLYLAGICAQGLCDICGFGSAPEGLSKEFFAPRIIELLQSIIGENPADAVPYLLSRCIWCIGKFSWACGEAGKAEFFLQPCISVLHANYATPIRLAACRSIVQLRDYLSAESLSRESLLSQAVLGVCNLLSAVTPDTMHVVLQTLSVLLEGHPAIAQAAEPQLSPVLVDIWAANVSDPIVCGSVVDVFQSIASNPDCGSGLQQRLLPTLSKIIHAFESNPPGVVEYALDLLTVMVRFSRHPQSAEQFYLSPTILESGLGPVMRFLLGSSDGAGLTSGADCLAAYLYIGAEQKHVWAASALSSIFMALHRLLSPDMPESAACGAGVILTQIFLRYNDLLPAENAKTLLQALLVKLHSSRLSNSTQSLVLPFCRLLHRDVNMTVSLLHSIHVQLPDGVGGHVQEPGFSVLLKKWVKEAPAFVGKFPVKISLLALALLFKTRFDILQKIQVEGDVEVDLREGRRLRSHKKAIKHSIVPLPLRILQLVLRAVEDPTDESGLMDNGVLSGALGRSGVHGASKTFAPADDFEEFMLSDIGGSLFWADDEEDDENLSGHIDAEQDPIFLADLQGELKNFVRTCPSNILNALATQLNAEDRRAMQVALS